MAGNGPEELIHSTTQANALGLRHEVMNPDEGDETANGVDQISGPSDLGQQVGRDASNDNLEEPLSTGCDSTAFGFDVGREDLAAYIPGYWAE